MDSIKEEKWQENKDFTGMVLEADLQWHIKMICQIPFTIKSKIMNAWGIGEY